jgi:hypothetical protein
MKLSERSQQILSAYMQKYLTPDAPQEWALDDLIFNFSLLAKRLESKEELK